jgi:hypothetical protein
LLFHKDYPFKPPNIVFLTPNGRFQVGKKICLSITGYHPESWRPAWGIRTALTAIISFMLTPGEGSVGAVEWSDEARRIGAKESLDWSCSTCGSHNRTALPSESEVPSVLLKGEQELVLSAPKSEPLDSKSANESAEKANAIKNEIITENTNDEKNAIKNEVITENTNDAKENEVITENTNDENKSANAKENTNRNKSENGIKGNVSVTNTVLDIPTSTKSLAKESPKKKSKDPEEQESLKESTTASTSLDVSTREQKNHAHKTTDVHEQISHHSSTHQSSSLLFATASAAQSRKGDLVWKLDSVILVILGIIFSWLAYRFL